MSDSGRVDTPPMPERMTKIGFVAYLLYVSKQALERADACGKASQVELRELHAQHERQLASVLAMLAEAVRSGLVVEARPEKMAAPVAPPPPVPPLRWWRRVVVAIRVLRFGRLPL